MNLNYNPWKTKFSSSSSSSSSLSLSLSHITNVTSSKTKKQNPTDARASLTLQMTPEPRLHVRFGRISSNIIAGMSPNIIAGMTTTPTNAPLTFGIAGITHEEVFNGF